MSKIALNRLIKCVCFILVMTFSLMAVSYMFAPKDNTAAGGITNPNAHGFFSEPRDTVDVAIIGNSDAYSGFSPMELWNEYGYTSYVSAEGRQTVSQSYVMLNSILKCQQPKLVILETDSFFTSSKIVQSAANMINASLGSSFSIFQYHNRWKSIKARDMLKKPKYTAHCITKGQMMSNNVKGYMGGEYMVRTEESAKIPLASKTSLDRFVRLCRDNGTEILFVELPSRTSWNYKKHNAVKEYADKNGIVFMDLNLNRDKFNFNWKTDTRDHGNHLNNSGARKCTQFIGEYLFNRNILKDHRNDSTYSSWKSDYKKYSKDVKI